MRVLYGILTIGLAVLGLSGIACEKIHPAESTDHVNLANVDTKVVTQLTGDQEKPSVATHARGAATFYVMKDGSVRYELVLNDIDHVTGAHLHAGDVGQVGPPIVTLYSTDQPTGKVDGVLVRGTVTQDRFMGPWRDRSMAELVHQLRDAGDVYVNVHTSEHPDGEIRGDIPYRR